MIIQCQAQINMLPWDGNTQPELVKYLVLIRKDASFFPYWCKPRHVVKCIVREPPEFLRVSENKLAWEQRKLSRKKKGSANRKKQITKVARVHRKIRNQRKDFAHKTSRELVNNYDLIAFENLNIRGMVQNHHLAKSISDAGWYQLQNFTSYKAEWAGKKTEFVIANGTSQECCMCGNIEHLTLADRVFKCSRCGNIKDRDVNASINIKNRAVGRGTTELTPVESIQKQLVEAGSPAF